MASYQEIVRTLTQGLANQLKHLKELEIELQSFEDQYSKDYKIVNDRIDDLNNQIDRTIKEAISNIKIPEAINGKDGKDFDEALLTKEIDKLTKQIDTNTKKIKSELLQTIKEIEIPQGEKGERGESISHDEVQDAVSIWIEENKDLLQGERGEKGERGLIGQQGQTGQDGVGIKDIKRSQDDLLITLTDGTEKRIKLPKSKQQFIGGGGGKNIENFSYDLVDRIVTIPYNQQMIVMGGIDIESELHLDGKLILED